VNSKITVAKVAPMAAPGDRTNIESALDYIRNAGKTLIANLENSNCDRRLLDGVKELQEQLIGRGDIVKIGLTNVACGTMCGHFQSELPEAILARFSSYTSSVSLYVAQFPEWEQFIQ
jgi:hypothetical protein